MAEAADVHEAQGEPGAGAGGVEAQVGVARQLIAGRQLERAGHAEAEDQGQWFLAGSGPGQGSEPEA